MENSHEDVKPRLPHWARIVLVIIAYFILVGIFQAIGIYSLNLQNSGLDKFRHLSVMQELILQSFTLTACLIVVFLFRKFIDQRSIKSLGFSFKKRFIDIVVGFLIALGIIGVGSIILSLFNYVSFSLSEIDIYSLFLSFLLFIMVALNEEIFARGYILNNLMSSMNKYLALSISAIIFALLHSLNFGLTIWAMVNLFLAGIILGSTYIFTKNLWFPISLHLFWNYFQGPVLGYSVSGQKHESAFTVKLFGSNLMNGGDFGFEGSIICTILLFMAIIMILRFYSKEPKQSTIIQMN